MADSRRPVPNAVGEALKGWWASLARVRTTLAAAAPALLLVQLVLTTATTLLVPVPWGVPEPQRGPVHFAAAVGWVVLPLAVGAWHRRRWWPPLCLAVVLGTAASWGGELIVGGYGEYGHGAPAATVDVLQPALVLGALAALMGAAGVALAPAFLRLDPRVRHWFVAAVLTAGIVPVVVAWVVELTVSADAGWVSLVSMPTLLAAATYGPYRAGRWIGQGWWILACLLIPAALLWYWALPYMDAVPTLSPTGWALAWVLPGFGSIFTAIAAGLAAVGVGQESSPGLLLPRGGPARRF